MDPENFPDPEAFKPERFIDDKTGHFVPNKAMAAFGIGKRECPGKSMAQIELFLFLTGLLQQFTFKPSEQEGLPDLNKADIGITRVQRPFKIHIEPRI